MWGSKNGKGWDKNVRGTRQSQSDHNEGTALHVVDSSSVPVLCALCHVAMPCTSVPCLVLGLLGANNLRLPTRAHVPQRQCVTTCSRFSVCPCVSLRVPACPCVWFVSFSMHCSHTVQQLLMHHPPAHTAHLLLMHHPPAHTVQQLLMHDPPAHTAHLLPCSNHCSTTLRAIRHRMQHCSYCRTSCWLTYTHMCPIAPPHCTHATHQCLACSELAS